MGWGERRLWQQLVHQDAKTFRPFRAHTYHTHTQTHKLHTQLAPFMNNLKFIAAAPRVVVAAFCY